jgi:hypothetical protein
MCCDAPVIKCLLLLSCSDCCCLARSTLHQTAAGSASPQSSSGHMTSPQDVHHRGHLHLILHHRGMCITASSSTEFCNTVKFARMTLCDPHARRSHASGRAVAPAVVLSLTHGIDAHLCGCNAWDRCRALSLCAVRTMSRDRDALNDDTNSSRVPEGKSVTLPHNLSKCRRVDGNRARNVHLAILDAKT